ncbi:4454_t:CDS:2 [Diversispora eburnea]|uniref:4454_t:CDS:1 n=1 Tax=Diversispora eburnea TaxID=1213867 RepID=A0A9N9AWH4_9GLOM|nr:4454_t:CDS:2 [Diversispora eburnea]
MISAKIQKFLTILILLILLINHLIIHVRSFEIPYQVPFSELLTGPKKVGIIGAGAGGSSAAYFLSNSFRNTSIPISITVYEKESVVGGRANSIIFERNGTKYDVEMGASIFVDVNYHLLNASKKFGLDLISFTEGYPEAKTAVWDGTEFVFEETSSTFWDIVKLFWTYGWTPIKIQRIVKDTINKFLKGYDLTEPFYSIDSELERLHLTLEKQYTGQYYFSELKNIGQLYLQHLVEPMTRVNYAQNLGEIHAMGTFISLAPQVNKIVCVRGGNHQIFENFIKDSEADLKLNTKVSKVTKIINDEGNIKYEIMTEDGSVNTFDAQFTEIQFINVNVQMKEVPYIKLYVSLVAGRLNPKYFGRNSPDEVPQAILTTNSGKTDFLSLAARTKLENGETLYKIFSTHSMSDELLDRIFTDRSSIYCKVWNSYPRLIPNQEFPRVELDDNFFYVNSYEPLISTMETECVSSNNIVKILSQRWINVEKVKANL